MNYDTQNPMALAEIPIQIVAEIGAKLQTADSDPVASIRMAYALLDAAEAARQSLQAFGCINQGLEQFDDKRKFQFYWAQIEAVEKADPLYQDKDGKPAPVSFEKALSSIFGKSIKKTDREKRTLLYLEWKDFVRRTTALQYPHLPPLRNRLTPSQEIQSWKTEGMPWKEYQFIKSHFPGWWKKRMSRTQASKRKGKTKGEAEPKGKQGRVIRKNDKRKGSRAGSFLKALKKNP